MFGYTIPIESALPQEDRISYRNYYCETCHHLREEYGFIPTLTVNYEMTFAALFFNSILDEGERIHYPPYIVLYNAPSSLALSIFHL